MIRGKCAIVSVYDKEGIVEFCRGLVSLGYTIISTSGTYRVLREGGVDVVEVSSVTNFPEILDGRVKTLHPLIHGGILYRNKSEHKSQVVDYGIPDIEIVVVNLYPFEEVLLKGSGMDEIVENIDIGGPALLRAGAKNFERVITVVDKFDYPRVLDKIGRGEVDLDFRIRLACKAFNHVARYDSVVAHFFNEYLSEKFPNETAIPLRKVFTLRYGENPHQNASVYLVSARSRPSVITSEIVVGGKELSYNNILDADVALEMISVFSDESFCCIIKHNIPSGAGVGDGLLEAYRKAYACDPVSAFGGIVGFSKRVTRDVAKEVVETFYEVIVAPDFDEDAMSVLMGRKNLRVIKVGELLMPRDELEIRSIVGGILVQEKDTSLEDVGKCRIVTKRRPTDREMRDLEFAWRIVKFVKSNAVVLAKDGATVGICGGQTSRVDSVKVAISRAKERGFSLEGAVCASEAFFPFKDSVEILAREGITAIIQPGGSVRDQDSIEEANRNNIAMVFTGVRHFRH